MTEDDFRGGSYTSTNPTAAPTTVTLEALFEVMQALKAQCPVAQYMLKHGFDPDRGDTLVVPMPMLKDFGPFQPRYLVGSKFVVEPILVSGNLTKTTDPIKPVSFDVKNDYGVITGVPGCST